MARKSILESPWYWVYAFCTAGLVAIVLIGPKFAERQAQIEREYQGRERAAQRRAGKEPVTPLSTAADTRITLRPIAIALAGVLAVAWGILWWRHFHSPSGRDDSRPNGLLPANSPQSEASARASS